MLYYFFNIPNIIAETIIEKFNKVNYILHHYKFINLCVYKIVNTFTPSHPILPQHFIFHAQKNESRQKKICGKRLNIVHVAFKVAVRWQLCIKYSCCLHSIQLFVLQVSVSFFMLRCYGQVYGRLHFTTRCYFTLALHERQEKIKKAVMCFSTESAINIRFMCIVLVLIIQDSMNILSGRYKSKQKAIRFF